MKLHKVTKQASDNGKSVASESMEVPRPKKRSENHPLQNTSETPSHHLLYEARNCEASEITDLYAARGYKASEILRFVWS